MVLYLFAVPLFRFAVLFLLLFGAAQLCECRVKLWRLLISSFLGAFYALACMVLSVSCECSDVINYSVVALLGLLAYGYRFELWSTYVCLYLITDGIIRRGDELLPLMAGVVGVFGLMYIRICRRGGLIVPVRICYNGKKISFHALRDTGNTLTDPVSGERVLVVNSNIAMELLGMNVQQLKDPLNSLGIIPGLRLIPYRTVGHKTDFMLAIRIKEVEIGRQKVSTVVAFAPEGLESAGRYQALTGGNLC